MGIRGKKLWTRTTSRILHQIFRALYSFSLITFSKELKYIIYIDTCEVFFIDIVRYVRVSRKLHVKRHSVDVSISSSSMNVYNTCHAISLSSCFSSGHTYIHREQKVAWRCAFTSWMVCIDKNITRAKFSPSMVLL